jgi:hypothetical protein
VEDLRPPRFLQRKHVLRHGHRRGQVPAQADELPLSYRDYNSDKRSYREFPIRWCELGTVYRYERAGALHGLLRVRGFTQDDAHIFCRPTSSKTKSINILDLNLHILKTFGFSEYDIYLSTRPEKYVGSDENWDKATEALKLALEKAGLAYHRRSRRRGLLRPENRYQDQGSAGPFLAVLDHPGRLQSAGTLRDAPSPAPTTASTSRS